MEYLLQGLGNRSPEGRRRSRREGGSTLWSFHGVVEIVVSGEMRGMPLAFSRRNSAPGRQKSAPGFTPDRVSGERRLNARPRVVAAPLLGASCCLIPIRNHKVSLSRPVNRSLGRSGSAVV